MIENKLKKKRREKKIQRAGVEKTRKTPYLLTITISQGKVFSFLGNVLHHYLSLLTPPFPFFFRYRFSFLSFILTCSSVWFCFRSSHWLRFISFIRISFLFLIFCSPNRLPHFPLSILLAVVIRYLFPPIQISVLTSPP